MDKRCKSCRFWERQTPSRFLNNRLDAKISDFGSCSSPKFFMGYAWCETEDGTGIERDVPYLSKDPITGETAYKNKRKPLALDQIVIETDEWWGAFFGCEFGCIHHESKK